MCRGCCILPYRVYDPAAKSCIYIFLKILIRIFGMGVDRLGHLSDDS